ncbi:protein unc-50 homolog [Anopheles arabiensis]|uniref:AGAP002901-PA n=5 Tax=gambiae species complex TaxID=44542 RepID=Q7PR08_ANOGA|nr:protein unc-50 homolog [Anopheles arabiensis]XP_041763020.1 protein unc-50 homolog [Anopheles merus]XP_049462612.1 protein unc-50 homolog [Anopheles coluzzii]XP_312002.3 protein unc-50 homolog isoform X2 [Anopheles gambiae]EAA08030.4 AGAP002901-PA [Anopheles gambiae str. PEST]
MKYATSPTPSRSNSSLLGMSSRTASPLPAPANYRDCMSATTKSYKYLRRFIKFDQMDFEYAMWQMVYLFIAPKKVYRNFNYRKQTKSQFARDDPAFLVLLVGCLCVTSIGFAWVLSLGFLQTILFTLYVVFVDCIFCGMIVATLLWVIANRYFRDRNSDFDMEWGYAFDVHLNAFFPPLILLHFIQLFFYHPLISRDWFISTFIGNTIWLLALGYYIYITFLGYNVVPSLKNTRIILVTLPLLCLFYVVTLIIGWNLSVSLMYYYHYRVL